MKILSVLTFLLAFSGLNNAMGQWTTGYGGFKVRNDTNGTKPIVSEPRSGESGLHINSAGNVGIGTTTPAARFHVVESSPGFTGVFGTPISTWNTSTNVSIGDDNGFSVLYLGQSETYKGFVYWNYEAQAENAYLGIGTSSYLNQLILQQFGGRVGINCYPFAALHLSTSGYDAYSGLMITNTRNGGKSLSISQGTLGKLDFANPGVIDLVTMDFNSNNVGIGTATPAPSAALEISSAAKGLLIPRLTLSQIHSISAPADGLEVFCTTDQKTYIYVNMAFAWRELAFGSETITPTIPPCDVSDAGPDQLDLPSLSTTLQGNTPTVGTGLWSILSGTGGNIADPSDPVSGFTGMAGNTYTLRWTITCDNGSNYDQVDISFLCTPQPTIANAGPNQLNLTTLTTTLQGNTPTSGTGLWSILSGTEGNIADSSNPVSSFTGIEGQSYELRWSITACSTSQDDVTISIACPTANAGPDQLDIPGTSTTLQGNTPFVGSGVWSIISGAGGNIVTPTDPGSTFTGVGGGNGYKLRWTVTSPNCGTITDSVIIQFACGFSITINHVAGNVAPVTKTTTYSTVSNIPGETSKCWITSNLGSDHQATTINDTTEASAGWYWQFNRQQGYKHNGITRTPNTTWISSIDENSDWISANDPCALELGVGWRLPTSTEWTNVDASGGWTNWNGPWNSALKLHAAGYLYYGNGLLYSSRGSYGYYASNSQYLSTHGYALFFYNSSCSVTGNYKADGFSCRCLRE